MLKLFILFITMSFSTYSATFSFKSNSTVTLCHATDSRGDHYYAIKDVIAADMGCTEALCKLTRSINDKKLKLNVTQSVDGEIRKNFVEKVDCTKYF